MSQRSLRPFALTWLMGIRIALAVGLAVLAAGISALPQMPALAQPSAPRLPLMPRGVPGHFSFGIMDGNGGTAYLDSMRTNNGTAWDYRYAYLAAGVNTEKGWATWNSPPGQYAVNFMQDNQKNGYLTAFVYYMLLQSNGPKSTDEMHTDLAHLDDASLMQSYYADWALLMQKIGADGAPVLVIVEPDLWGYIEQAAVLNGSNSAASIPASVASSGYAGVQGYPNTAQGFAWALLHLRDRYAPNAILAVHASNWGTRQDISSNTDPNLDVTALGTQEGQFFRTAGLAGTPSGVSTWDLVSNDIADHDSGQSGIWWDASNVALPNFARYLQFIHAVSVAAGRRIMMWQVPVGNQYFDTENNSAGHTQDNRPAYILSHIADFVNAGVIGVLFGPGNGGTSVFDNQNDGVTNPTPISTFECNFCNNHTSSYPDDDGGFLRIFLGQYYRNGTYPLSGVVPTPTPRTAATATSVPTTTATPANAGESVAGSTTSQHGGPSVASSHDIAWLIAVVSLLVLITGAGGGLFWWRRRRVRPTFAGEDAALEPIPDHWADVTHTYDNVQVPARPDVGAGWGWDEATPTRPSPAPPQFQRPPNLRP